MITLDSKNPPLGLWFIAIADDKTDFLGCLQPKLNVSGTPVPGSFQFDFRFRYHKDDKVFDSEDEKHWYHMEAKNTTADEIIHKTREVILRVAQMHSHDGPSPPDVDELLWRDYNDWDAFMEAFEAKPYAYAKMASQEYAEELLKEAK